MGSLRASWSGFVQTAYIVVFYGGIIEIVDEPDARINELPAGSQRGVDAARQPGWSEKVVGVENIDKVPSRQSQRLVDRLGDALFSRCKTIAERSAPAQEVASDFGGVISGAVVDGDDFNRPVILFDDGLQSLLDIGPVIVHGDENADQRSGHYGGSFAGSSIRRIVQPSGKFAQGLLLAF